jgi:hypothetical protein
VLRLNHSIHSNALLRYPACSSQGVFLDHLRIAESSSRFLCFVGPSFLAPCRRSRCRSVGAARLYDVLVRPNDASPSASCSAITTNFHTTTLTLVFCIILLGHRRLIISAQLAHTLVIAGHRHDGRVGKLVPHGYWLASCSTMYLTRRSTAISVLWTIEHRSVVLQYEDLRRRSVR